MRVRMFPHTVTLYQTSDDGAEITVLRGVLLVEADASHAKTTGYDGADSPRLYVPFAVDAADGRTGEPKAYAGPVAYEDAAEKSGLWTFPTDGSGFFVKGEVVEPDLDRQEMEARHDGVYSIVSVTARDFGPPHMRHWEIGGA